MLDERGRLIWRVLFGVIMAALLLGIFLIYTSTQNDYAIGSEAQTLADDLSHSVFSALTGQEQILDLPDTVGNASYELDMENSTFIVRITGGEMTGKEYRSTVGIKVELKSLPEPGHTLYARGAEKMVVISSTPTAPEEGPKPKKSFETPEFYQFAKNNPRAAAGIIASYYYARERYSQGENLDLRKFEWNSQDELKVRITSSENISEIIKVSGRENHDTLGQVENSWIISNLEPVSSAMSDPKSCPSVREAHETGWLYPPEEILSHLLGRTWKRTSDNRVLDLTEKVERSGAAVTTKVSTYPVWRYDFSQSTKCLIYSTIMPWNPQENMAAFVFESKPDLRAIG